MGNLIRVKSLMFGDVFFCRHGRKWTVDYKDNQYQFVRARMVGTQIPKIFKFNEDVSILETEL